MPCLILLWVLKQNHIAAAAAAFCDFAFINVSKTYLLLQIRSILYIWAVICWRRGWGMTGWTEWCPSGVLLSLNTLSLVCRRADDSCKGTEEKQDSYADSLWQLAPHLCPLHYTPLPSAHTNTQLSPPPHGACHWVWRLQRCHTDNHWSEV